MNRPRKQPVLDPETAAAFAYQERHMQSNIVAIDRDGFANPAPPCDLERALDAVRRAQWNTHPKAYDPKKGRWQQYGRN